MSDTLNRGQIHAEAPNLRFANIYHSPEWKGLDLLDRAQLLLVAEGVKPGTIIGGNFTGFQKVVKDMGLSISLNTEPNQLEPIYEVATADVFTEHYRDLLMLPEIMPEGEYHRINGKFLGYPRCCTEEYNNPQKNYAARLKKSPQVFLSNVDYELEDMIEKTGSYPEEFDFCPPSFTPCSAYCEEARKTLQIWRNTMQIADPEAAKILQIFNWRSSPAAKVHSEKLAEIDQQEELEWQRRSLRQGMWDVLR